MHEIGVTDNKEVIMQYDAPERDYERLARASQRRATFGLIALMGGAFLSAILFMVLMAS